MGHRDKAPQAGACREVRADLHGPPHPTKSKNTREQIRGWEQQAGTWAYTIATVTQSALQ